MKQNTPSAYLQVLPRFSALSTFFALFLITTVTLPSHTLPLLWAFSLPGISSSASSMYIACRQRQCFRFYAEPQSLCLCRFSYLYRCHYPFSACDSSSLAKQYFKLDFLLENVSNLYKCRRPALKRPLLFIALLCIDEVFLQQRPHFGGKPYMDISTAFYKIS